MHPRPDQLDPFFDGWIYPRQSCAGQTASGLFQYAAHTLSTATAGCVVVQDSSFGIQAL
jgi:beta-phosphoglucomutase-like phosphatase (HAD superfamily)